MDEAIGIPILVTSASAFSFFTLLACWTAVNALFGCVACVHCVLCVCVCVCVYCVCVCVCVCDERRERREREIEKRGGREREEGGKIIQGVTSSATALIMGESSSIS